MWRDLRGSDPVPRPSPCSRISADIPVTHLGVPEWRSWIPCFPSADRAFFEHEHQATDSLTPAEAQSAEAAEKAAAIIRERYPNVRISVGDGLAVLRADEPHWYAYRDGRPDARSPGAALGGKRRPVSRAIRAISEPDSQA